MMSAYKDHHQDLYTRQVLDDVSILFGRMSLRSDLLPETSRACSDHCTVWNL